MEFSNFYMVDRGTFLAYSCMDCQLAVLKIDSAKWTIESLAYFKLPADLIDVQGLIFDQTDKNEFLAHSDEKFSMGHLKGNRVTWSTVKAFEFSYLWCEKLSDYKLFALCDADGFYKYCTIDLVTRKKTITILGTEDNIEQAVGTLMVGLFVVIICCV